MSTQPQSQTPKDKYKDLLKEIRLQKSLPVLEKIYEDLKQNKEHLYDDSVIPFQFSDDFVWFLKYNFISAQTQMDIFKLYIEEFFSLRCKPENLPKIKFLFEIFNYDSNFFNKASNIDNFLVFLNRFFNVYYPKDNSIKHEEGDYMDVLISEEREKLPLNGWIQLKIKRIDKDKKLYIFEDYKDDKKEMMVAFDNFKVQERNKFVTEEEMTWRKNLKVGDKLDFLTNNRNWVEASVKEIISEKEIGINCLEQSPNVTNIINRYSPFIQPYLKYSFKFEEDELNCISLLDLNEEFCRYNYMVPCTETNHLVPFEGYKFYSLEYYEILNFFINKLIEKKTLLTENLSIDYIYVTLNILYSSGDLINQRFLGEYFEKNGYENIKKILINFSLDKKVNKPKFIFENIIIYTDKFFKFIHYKFQLCKFLPEFIIEFGYNCFKNSESLEKRLLGLNIILKVLPTLNKFFPIISNDVISKITALISEKLLGSGANTDLFGLLFNDPNIHEQLLLKGVEIIIFLTKLKFLDDQDIERLYNLALSSQPDSDIYKSLYDLLNKITNDIDLSQEKVLFDKIISFPYDKIRENDITLMTNVLQNIKNEEEFKNMTKTFLDYYYNYIVIFRNKDESCLSIFAKILSFAKDEENMKFLYTDYFEKIVEDLNNQNDLEGYKFFFIFIHQIFYPLKERSEKNERDQGCISFLKIKFREIFIKSNKNMEIIVDKLIELINKDKSEIKDEIKVEDYIIDVINILNQFIEFNGAQNFYTVESMKKLCDYFVFGDILKKKKGGLLYKINNFKMDKSDKEKFLEYFFERFDKFLNSINSEHPERYALLDQSLVSNIFTLFKDINNPIQAQDDDSYFYRVKYKFELKLNPLEFKYFNIIWKMYLKYNNFSDVKGFLEYFSLKNFSPEERHEIWEKLIKLIFEGINNNIYLSLKMLEFLITTSEKYGSAGAKSHFVCSKRKIPVRLTFKNDMSKSLSDFTFPDEIFYSTDTVFDIKKKIQKKYGIDPIFIDIGTNKGYSRNPDHKALIQLFPKIEKNEKDEEFIITFRRSHMFDLNLCYPYKNEIDNKIMPKYEEILQEVFLKYSKDEKMDYLNFKQFFNNYFNNNYNVDTIEKDAKEQFNKADPEKKGYLTYQDYLNFYDTLMHSNYSCLYGFYNLGYTSTLDYYLSPIKKDSPFYYQENNKKEFMPRYIIGNNKEYMGKLFSFARYENKDILETAQQLIQDVCTLEEMKKTLFERSNKIGEVISNPNLELRGYAFDILMNQFENEENDKNTNNMVDNFINNNLKKLIIELEKFSENSEEKQEEQKQEEQKKEDFKVIRYFNFYFTNLKIILYTFKKIIGNTEVISHIDKFDNLEDENEKNDIKNLKFDLSPEKQKLIQSLELKRLINIIGNNTIIISEKSNQSFKIINISVKLLIYIILFSKDLPEKEKEEIYTNYTNFEILLTQTSSFSLKRLFFTANKLLLNFMNSETDKKFILVKYDKFVKEIMGYDKLSIFEGRLSLFFKIFIDLLQISIKGTQNDKIFTLYGDLKKLILDKKIELNGYLVTWYLNIIKEILTILKNEKYNKLYETDLEPLLNILIKEFIITFDTDENGKITEINNLKNYSRYSEEDFVSYLFQILSIIISINPEKYLKIFFLNEDIKNLREKHLTKLEESVTGYNPYKDSRSLNSHIGLKNLSSICYMNSVLQQFFMMPLFRNAILSLPIPQGLDETKEDNDNLLFQLIRMFYYLNYSDKGYYNPKNFVYSFKDYDGNPTKIHIQCDAQEFLSRFVEKMEEGLKNNSHKFLCNNIFGGTTLQQVKCTNPDCGNISERKENINFLSLDIKNMKNVEECLNKFILEEKIEDYLCEKCKKKITNIKNVLIDKIPNILIIHLQRFAFSYETFNMEKVNSQVNFEKELNIKKYTVNKDNKDIPLEYFDYDLQGIIIHSGTAQYGHYYSLTSNDMKDKEKNSESVKKDKWFKFNDSTVTKVDYDSINYDAFGNSSSDQYGSSAYMLIYQKTVKKPVIINAKEINEENKKKISEEKTEKVELEKDKIYYIYENEKDAVENNTDTNKLVDEVDNINKNIVLKNSSVEANLVSYQEALNSLIKENNENKGKKPFLYNILLENVKICNDKKFYTKSFVKFIKDETELIKKEIIYDKTGQKINEYLPILKVINDYVFFIIPFTNFLDNADLIIHNMVSIINFTVPKEFISFLVKDIIDPKKDDFYCDYLCSRDNKKGKILSTYIGKILSISINNNIEVELVNKIIQFYLDKIPVEITKKWLDMDAFNNLILTLVENSDVIKKSFITNGILAKLIDLIMGKESPLYQGDERTENKNNKPKFGNIVKAIALLYKYYAENYEKEELKLSKSDLVMINCNKFYEKVVLDDYDSDASNMLIDYKMNLIMILNKGENKDEFDKEIIDILINLKIPNINKKDEIISGLTLISHIIEKYAEMYNINDSKEEKNKDKFIEKLNILLGVPVPVVKSGEAEIKYISGRYQEKYTILSNIFSQKERNKEALDLLKALFNLFNINKTVFDYINKLPAPNSYKYSFIDYCIKLYLLVFKDLEGESKVMDEMEMDNPYKEFDKLVNEICSKNNKDINSVKNNDKICLDNVIYFNQFSYQYIKDVKFPDKVSGFLLKLNYISGKNLEKTNLACFTNINYFSNLNGKQTDDKNEIKDENDIHSILCVVIHSLEDLDISINLNPYFSSKMALEAKKDCHYFLYSTDINDEIKKDDDKIFKSFELNNIKIEAKERKLLALPQGNSNQAAADDGCAINCSICGTVNILNEGNQEYKCIFCESPLF